MTTTTTTRPAPSITRMDNGKFLLTGLPFMIDGVGREGGLGRAAQVMNSRGLGWAFETFADGTKGWVSGEPGAAREAIAKLATYGVKVTDLTGTAARKTSTKASTKAPAKATAKASGASIMSNAETAAYGARASMAATIAAALTADGVHPDVIAAAITAATAAADKLAKSVGATVSAPVPAPKAHKASRKDGTVSVRQAPAKATAKATAKVSPDAVLAARRALAAAKITGVSVRKTGEAFRMDGAKVDAAALKIVADAIAAA